MTIQLASASKVLKIGKKPKRTKKQKTLQAASRAFHSLTLF
jgi:hypothetical protein